MSYKKNSGYEEDRTSRFRRDKNYSIKNIENVSIKHTEYEETESRIHNTKYAGKVEKGR